MLPLDRLKANPHNARRHADQEYIKSLAQSLEQHGQLDSILVRPADGDSLEIVAGHRRVEAARLARWTEIRGEIRTLTDEEADCLGLVSNIERANLSEVEEADGIAQLMQAHGWTQARVADRLHRTQAWVSYKLSLLRSAPEVQEMLITQVISPTQAREIAKAPMEMQLAIGRKAAAMNLTKDRVQKLVQVATDPTTPEDVRRAAVEDSNVTPEHAAAIARAENPVLRQGLIRAVEQGQMTPEQTASAVEAATKREQAPPSITSAHIQRRVNIITPLKKAVEALESVEADDAFRLGSEDGRGNPFTDPLAAARESIGRITSLASRIAMWLDAAENRQLAPQQGGSGKVLRFPGAGGTAS